MTTRHYYVYDIKVIDEEVCQRQGRTVLADVDSGYEQVMIHKHRYLERCIDPILIGGVFDALNQPVYNQHCYELFLKPKPTPVGG